MCVVALALDHHPRWRLVLAGNRDEFHERPAQPLARWADARHVIAGRDVQAGGSWLGVSDAGRLAVVTNIRTGGLPDPAKLSRGALVGDWLAAGVAPAESALAGYNPFNLLLLGPEGAQLFSNLPAPQRQPLGRGIHGLSNGHPGEAWPRRSMAEAALARWLDEEGDIEALFAMLRDEGIADDVGQPIFINAPVYGTRCSTVVLVDRQGQGQIVERCFDPNGGDTGETALAFRWPAGTGANPPD